MTSPAVPTTEAPGLWQWFGLAVVALPTLLLSIDTSHTEWVTGGRPTEPSAHHLGCASRQDL